MQKFHNFMDDLIKSNFSCRNIGLSTSEQEGMTYVPNLEPECTIEYITEPSLAPFSSFKIGGKAKLALFPRSVSALTTSISLLKKHDIPYIVIGNASNVLFPDEGLNCAVVFTTKITGIKVEGNIVYAECGVSVTALASRAQKHGLDGLQFAYGIPGSLGGGIYMNAGAYDGQMSDVVISTTYYDPNTDQILELKGAENDFGYRKSYYMKHPELVILSATFELKPGDKDSIKVYMDDIMQRRKDKQPLEYPSAGSVFKRYPGYFTSMLIEQAGLKGCRIGGAEVSTKHAGFIINVESATAKDVKELITHIQSVIHDKNGIDIEPEIRIINKV